MRSPRAVQGARREALAPVARMSGRGALPQVGEAALDGVGGLRRGVGGVDRHERREPGEVRRGPGLVARALEQLEEVVIEVEDPDVPVRDEVERLGHGVGMRVGAEQRVVHRVERRLVPDLRRSVRRRRVEDPHLARPSLGVHTCSLQRGIQACRIRHVELGKLEGLPTAHDWTPPRSDASMSATSARRVRRGGPWTKHRQSGELPTRRPIHRKAVLYEAGDRVKLPIDRRQLVAAVPAGSAAGYVLRFPGWTFSCRHFGTELT